MKTFKFYGVDCNCYKLDDKVWEAIEDPSDGYRSYLGSIELKDNIDNLVFFPEPVAEVFVKNVATNVRNGFELVDSTDDFVWLFIGTDNVDGYYPCFRFEYHAKPPKLTWEEFIQE